MGQALMVSPGLSWALVGRVLMGRALMGLALMCWGAGPLWGPLGPYGPVPYAPGPHGALMGLPGPLWSGPFGPGLVGLARVVCRPPRPSWPGPFWLGPYGPGPHGSSWALVEALMGRALLGTLGPRPFGFGPYGPGSPGPCGYPGQFC